MRDRQPPPRESLPLPPCAGAAGFTLIEALVAAGLLLIIAVGILPLFVRAIVDNAAGNEYTQVSNHGKSRAEELYQLPFNSPPLAIAIGSQEATTDEWWSQDQAAWQPGVVPDPPPAGDLALWGRQTVIRQYSVSAIDDDPGTVDLLHTDALDGGENPDFIHLKEIEVTVDSTRDQGPLGAGKQIRLRTFRAI